LVIDGYLLNPKGGKPSITCGELGDLDNRCFFFFTGGCLPGLTVYTLNPIHPDVRTLRQAKKKKEKERRPPGARSSGLV
jgi:hypothetical protein